MLRHISFAGACLRSQVTRARAIIYGLSMIVLLVVGLNISGMMLVRSAIRERELAIRSAMGASRWRLMRHHLTEALVLALFGGAFASAVLFFGPVAVACVRRVGTRARPVQARCGDHPAVPRPLLRDEPRARTAAGDPLQPHVRDRRAQERLDRQRPARWMAAAAHRGGAGRHCGPASSSAACSSTRHA